MNLLIDFGNTRIKTAVFDGKQLVKTQVFTSVSQLLEAFQANTSIKNCFIASVTEDHTPVIETFSKFFKTSLFTPKTPIPLINNYTSALSLGSDRVAASVGAFALFPNQNTLTIDSGTCIKYNFVNAKNEYLGGAISPGIPMRLKAMNAYTSALPLVPFDIHYTQLIGTNTQQSLLSGALIASACEVDGMIDRYNDIYPDLKVVITGGDADYLCKQLKNRFFADQHLLLLGLNTILHYSLENQS